MLQRLQSLLMAFIVIALFVLFFVPIFEIRMTDSQLWLGVCVTKVNQLGTVSSSTNYLTILLTLLPMTVTAYSISQFKKRPLQLKLGLFNTLMLTGLLGAMVMIQSNISQTYSHLIEAGEATSKFGFGFFIPAICLILNMISIRFIRRDERMVKDAFDRLR
jgi:hypothetical protein